MAISCMAADELKEAFVAAVGLSSDTDWASVEYGSTIGWDSMAHLQLVSELERRFQIALSTNEVMELNSFNKAKQIAEAHGIAFHA